MKVRRVDGYYRVFKDGKAISGKFSQPYLAEAEIDRQEAISQRSIRNCMCCEEPFRSDGIHNRLCVKCKS